MEIVCSGFICKQLAQFAASSHPGMGSSGDIEPDTYDCIYCHYIRLAFVEH